MGSKIKQTQKEDLENSHGRDLFQTPNYATDLLAPFLDKKTPIWECAAGRGKIVNRLKHHGFKVLASELDENTIYEQANFLLDPQPRKFKLTNRASGSRSGFCIVTNPPYSLKKKFYLRCLDYRVPFALLIPADYSGWVIEALQNGAEKIIPTRRIDFITPTGKSGATGQSANYHSLWLTYGFGLGRTETFVELTKEMKENI